MAKKSEYELLLERQNLEIIFRTHERHKRNLFKFLIEKYADESPIYEPDISEDELSDILAHIHEDFREDLRKQYGDKEGDEIHKEHQALYAQARRDAIRGDYENLKTLMSHWEKQFPEEIQPETDRWPVSWMRADKTINGRINNDKTFQKAIKIMNYLWKHKLSASDSEVLSERIGAGLHISPTGKRHPYCFISEINYPQMERSTGIKASVIRIYIPALANVGWLKKFKKAGPNGHMIYAIGYIAGNTSAHIQRHPLLTVDMKQALRDFNPEYKPITKEKQS